MMRCLLVSSCSLFPSLLSGLLTQLCGVPVACCGPMLAEVGAIAERWQPDLLLLHGEAAESACALAITDRLLSVCPEARVLVLQGHHHQPAAAPALRALHRDAVLEPPAAGWSVLQLVELIARLAGQDGMAGSIRGLPPVKRLQGLAPRERAVLHCLGDGLTSREIAAALSLTLQTVETYRKALAAKLGVSGSQLVRVAVLCRCTDPGDALALQPPPPIPDASPFLNGHGVVPSPRRPAPRRSPVT